MSYYKAVHADGADFATGKTRPVLGTWMPRIKGRLIMCKRGYHVSSAVAETLSDGWWPCRLYEVEIPDGDWKQDGHNVVVPTYQPIRELPSWMALGPNGQEVAAFIERCRAITPAQARRLYAAGVAAWGASRRAAGCASRLAAQGSDRGAALVAARDAVWDSTTVAVWDTAGYALAALVVRDLISPEQFDALYGPWRSVMENQEPQP